MQICSTNQNKSAVDFFFYLKRKTTNVNKKIHVFELSKYRKTGKPGAMAAQVLRLNLLLKQKKKISTLKPDLKKIYISNNKSVSLDRTFIHSKERYSCRTQVLNHVESQR